MMGINFPKVALMLGKNTVLRMLCGQNGAFKIILNQVNKALLEKEIDLLKVLIRNIANQNKTAYDEIEKEMRKILSEEEFSEIFGC